MLALPLTVSLLVSVGLPSHRRCLGVSKPLEHKHV